MSIKAIKKVIGLINGADERSQTEHQKFLEFLEVLVSECGPAASKEFGRMTVRVDNGKEWGIELTPTDLLWWRSKILHDRVRFCKGAASVQADIVSRLSNSAGSYNFTPEERQEFIAIMKTVEI